MKSEELKKYIKKLIVSEVKKTVVPTVVKVIRSRVIKEQINNLINEQLNQKLVGILAEQKGKPQKKSLGSVFKSSGDSDIDDLIEQETKKEAIKKEDYRKRVQNMIVDENTKNIFGDFLNESPDEVGHSPSVNSFSSEPTIGPDGMPTDSDDDGIDISQFGF